MAKIDTSGWREFSIGSIFNVVKGTRLTKANMLPGETRFIGSSAMNNGCTALVGNNENIHPKNTITVCYNGSIGETFYQDEPFLASDDVNVLYPKFEMNKEIALFIVPLIKSVSHKYTYIDKWKREDMIADKIKLPVLSTGEIDWNYMKQYMQKMLNEVGSSIENLSRTDNRKHEINISEWKEFVIGDLFEKLQLGIKKKNFNKVLDVSEERTDEFNLPLINAKHSNNGVMYFGREEDFETAEMTIDIVQNGAIATGDVYAQPQKTGVLWDAYLIKSKQEIKSPEALLFISAVLEKTIKDKFSYDDKCVWDKASLLSIKLPVDNNGNPDYTYMELYMKSMMDSAESVIEKFESLDFKIKN